MTDFEKNLARFRIPLADLRTATNNFAEKNLLKRGYNSDFYQGKLQLWSKLVTGRDVVIRKFHSTLFQFTHDFNEWIEKLISGLKHKKFVCFIGFCDEEGEKMIVMERVVNGSLHMHLRYGTLTCLQRLEVCFDVAVALKDWIDLNGDRSDWYGIGFKIMLDKDWKAKILLCFELGEGHSASYYLGKMLLEVLYGRKVTNEDVIQVKQKYDIIDNIDSIDPYLEEEMHPKSLFLFREVIMNCFVKPEEFRYVGIPLLKEAHEIQWKLINSNPLEKIKHLKIPLNKIKSATADFNHTYTWHRDVYKAEVGELPKKKVFIKRSDKNTDVLKASFIEKIEMLTHYKHPSNQVSFLGYCDEESEMILVFEYTFKENIEYYWDTGCSWAVNVSVNGHDLTWQQRIWICLDIAHGLQLTTMIPIVELFENHPLYGVFLQKHKSLGLSDEGIYLFGVFLFEILTGSRKHRYLKEVFANGITSTQRLKDMADDRIRNEVGEKTLDTFIEITRKCLTVGTPSERPTLEVVIKSLKEVINIHDKEQFLIPRSVIVKATNDFDKENLIGCGGFGKVYKADLDLSNIENCYRMKLRSRYNSSTMLYTVAIKRIPVKNANRRDEVLSVELDVLRQCEDPNIVTLLAYNKDDKEMLLVYEYASNGSLEQQLKSTNKEIRFRQWTQRLKICIDIAKGLEYLHTNTEAKRVIVHRDIKSANILLFENMKAKIADFGLSRVHVGKESTINTIHCAGTDYYIDPEYANTGRLKKASDIYSFGVVLFEIFSGKLVFDDAYIMHKDMCLVPIARTHFMNGTLKEILDEKLMEEAFELGLTLRVRPDQDSLDVFSKIAYQCMSRSQDKRPTIQAVIHDLKKALQLQENRMTTNKFSLEDIKRGTNNFSDDKCILKEGHGMLYEGTIQDPDGHTNVLIKQFSINQERGFLKEFEVLFKYKHENIIGLVGYSKEMDERIIVYEHASKGCLNRYLKDTSFSWIQRLKVCIDIARGLKFLHEGDVGQDVVIHRDIKSSNILLTIDWKAKIYGFKDALKDVVGSAGYLDPSHLDTNDLTKESDIYSFGVVLFEILCGRMALPEENSDDKQMLDFLVKSCNREARVEEIVFEELKKQIVRKSFTVFRRISFKCLHEKREKRPRAGDVLEELKKALKFQEDYEERKAKLNSIYKKILDGKLDIYNILSEELLHEDDKLIDHIIEPNHEEDQDLELESDPSKTVDEDYYSDRAKRRRY